MLDKFAKYYYTPKEAAQVLGLTGDTLQNWVRAGRVKREKSPVTKQYVYAKKEIDELALAIEVSLLANQSYDFEFKKATPESLEKELALAVLVFGEKTATFHEYRRDLLKRNPDMSYYLFDRENLVASINFVPLRTEGIAKFKEGERGWLLGEYVESFEPDKPQECIIIDLMTTPLVPANRRKFYAGQLFFHLARLLEEWGQQGYNLTRVFANGGTLDGRRVLETAGFQRIAERGARIIYELDVASSDLHLLDRYKSAFAEWGESHR